MSGGVDGPTHDLESLAAFRPVWDRECMNCGAKPVVAAVDLCGPCTWGETATAGGQWWDDVDEQRYQDALLAERSK